MMEEVKSNDVVASPATITERRCQVCGDPLGLTNSEKCPYCRKLGWSELPFAASPCKTCGRAFRSKSPGSAKYCPEHEPAATQRMREHRARVRAEKKYLAKNTQIDEGAMFFETLREAAFYCSHRLSGHDTGYNSTTFFDRPAGRETDQLCCERIYELEEYLDKNGGLDALKPSLEEDPLYFERKAALTICRGFQHRVLKMPTYLDFKDKPVSVEAQIELCSRFAGWRQSQYAVKQWSCPEDQQKWEAFLRGLKEAPATAA
jgi:hypothetical protein